MDDALTRLHTAAKPLLARVDATLSSHGAPPDHPVWPLLRRCGLLPGDAVADMVAWEPEPLCERARLLRTHREGCSAIDTLLRRPSTWEGSAAATFAARLESTRSEHDTLAANTATLARHLEELADWTVHARNRLAHTLAHTLASTQSLTLTTQATATAATATTTTAGFIGSTPTPSPQPANTPAHSLLPTALATSAADVATELLTVVDHFWQGALEISEAWSARLDTTIPPPAFIAPIPHTPPTLRVDL